MVTREDVRKRKQEQQRYNETCVKCCLQKMIRGNRQFKMQLSENIDKRVESYSLHIALGSRNLNGIVKHIFKSVRDSELPLFQLPLDIFNQTVIRNIILNPQSMDNECVRAYVQHNPGCIPKYKRYFGDGQTFSYGRDTLITALKNSLWMNLTKRIKKILRHQESMGLLDEDARIWLLFAIHGWQVSDERRHYQPSQSLIETAARHRAILGLNPGVVITDKWSKSHLVGILKYYVYVNRFLEEHKLPCFNITPIFDVKRHFMSIDTAVFYGIMKELKIVDCNITTFQALAMHHFTSVFNIHSVEGKRCRFTRMVQSDGVSLVVHFTRPKNAQDKAANNDFKIDPTHRLIAIDPGRENIYYGVEVLNNEVRSYVLTRKQYYQEAGMLNARKNVHKWHKSISQNLEAMTKVSSKGVNHNRHATYLSAYAGNVDAMWNEYTKKRWARQRLRLYGGKKRVFAKFFKEMENADANRKITVAYGSASFSPGGKGEVNVPVGRAFNECKMRFPTTVVDEFRTTAVHHGTDTMLQKVQRRKDKGTRKTVRGLLWCSSTKRKNKFVNRDLNAALNILRCALGHRPEIMTRDSKIKVDNSVGKLIRS